MFNPQELSFRRVVLPAALLASALFAPAGRTQDSPNPVGPNDVVLTVGDRKITKEEFEKITENLPQQFAGALAQLGTRGFADQYGNLLALSIEGEKLSLSERDEFRRTMEFQRMLLLAQSAVNELAGPEVPLTEAAIQKEYADHQDELQEVHLRGIYTPFDPTESELEGNGPDPDQPRVSEAAALAKATSLRTRILAGEDLAELARVNSEHPTATTGGDFGFVKRGQFAPEIDETLFSMETNQITEPLRDRFGYFIFRLEEKRTAPLDQVRPAVENVLRQRRMLELFTRVKAAYPITLNDRYFTDPPEPPGALAPQE